MLLNYFLLDLDGVGGQIEKTFTSRAALETSFLWFPKMAVLHRMTEKALIYVRPSGVMTSD